MDTATATRRIAVRYLQYNIIATLDRTYRDIYGSPPVKDRYEGSFETRADAEAGIGHLRAAATEDATRPAMKMWDPENKGELVDHPKPIEWRIEVIERVTRFEEVVAIEDL